MARLRRLLTPALGILCLSLGCRSIPIATQASPAYEPSEVVLKLERQYRLASKLLRRNKKNGKAAAPKVLETLSPMKEIYRSGKDLDPGIKKSDLWKDYCQAGLDILSDAEHQLGIGYTLGALRSLERLGALQTQIHPDFQPGLWKKILSWFGRV